MNISTEPRQTSKHIQQVPHYDQDDKRVNGIKADHTNQTNSIVNTKGSTPNVQLSPTKNQIPDLIEAAILRSPTMEIAPEFHPNESATSRTTTEAVDPSHPQTITETTIFKPQTRGIKESLLLQTLSAKKTLVSTSSHVSLLRNVVEDPRRITIDETNMQSETF